MKTLLTLLLSCLLAYTTASAQTAKPSIITASLLSVGESSDAEKFAFNEKRGKAFTSIRPVTILYKEAPWNLMVVDLPDEKQVVHFSEVQMDAIAAIVEAKDGKTHYIEVTNFYDVYAGNGKMEVNQDFLSSMESAIKRRRWYKNNAVFMVSSTTIDDQHVVRFKLPFANDSRICRHVKALYNLKEGYYETTPAAFLKLLRFTDASGNFNANAN